MNPFNKTGSETAADWGEIRLIAEIQNWLGDISPPAPEGIGDDCAVFTPTPGSRILITTDPILWNRHFDESVTPELAAAKLLKRNLSDIAAMGGKPTAAVISLFIPHETSVEWLKRFHLGLRQTAIEYNIPINGGDVSAANDLAATLTLIGETSGNNLLTRTGAKPGDLLFVTGHLGGSILGHHTGFTPRLKEGQWLAARPEVTAAIDISDGIAKEIPLLLPPGCEAFLKPESIPISADSEKIAQKTGKPALYHAICDGEDYELLFTVKPESATKLLEDWNKTFPNPLHKIGSIILRNPDQQGPLLRGLPAEIEDHLQPYEHFRR